MDSLFATYNLNLPENFELYVLALLMVIICILSVIALIESYNLQKFKGLYLKASRELKKQTKIKKAFEQELNTLVDLMDELNFPIWQRDKDLNIIYCNSKYCEIVGEIREKVLQEGHYDLFRNAKPVAVRALRAGKNQVFEQNIVIDGVNTLNQIVEIPISDKSLNQKARLGTVGFALNLSELQSTRERLKGTLELQKRLLGNLNNAIAIYGPTQRLEYYNTSFVNLWKLDDDWLKNSPTYGDILEALRDKRKLPEQADFETFKSDNVKMFSNLIEMKEDYYYLTDGTVLKVIIIPYQQSGLLFYYEDMTSRINLERRYETLLSSRRYTMDNLNEAIAVFNDVGCLKIYNPNFTNMWGLTTALLDSEPHISKILDEEKGLFEDAGWDDYKEDFMRRFNSREFSEKKVVRKDERIINQRITPLPDGEVLLIYDDITDKENVEKSLRAERKAYEEADIIKTNFLSNVSYELRSPLTSIMGFSEILMMDIVGKIDDKSKTYLKAIFDSSVKLKYLIDNIIDVSTIDAGYISMNIKSFSPKDAFAEILDDIEKDALKKNIKINIQIKKGIKSVEADKSRVQQVIKTLAGNAIVMSSKNQSIDISLKSDKDNFIIEVSDKGYGIPEEDLHLIFDQFYKIQTDSSFGTGLGLYLSKKIISLHKGDISVESKMGKGSKFIVTIPLESQYVEGE